MTPPLFNAFLEVLANAITKEKDTRSINIINEEVKWSLLTDDTIVPLENSS